MTRNDGRRWSAVWLLAALCASAAFLAATPPAGAAPASQSQATAGCGNDVINDWLAHEPNVVGSYPIGCYTQAIQDLDSYPDIQGYSNAPDDIRRALLAALRNNGPGGSNHDSSGPTSGGDGNKSSGGGADKGVFTKIFDAVAPGNAQSVPLPLLVLAGLALILLLTAGGTYVAKRIQERRIAPAPARRP